MKVSGEWLTDSGTKSVLMMLENGGFQGYAVGGCVRNALLSAPVADVDIATDARPETVVKLAKKAGLKAVPTGIEHGTVTVVVEGTGFEVTTFRRDVATDGRRATVEFADNLVEDAHRRDFTINALYVAADGTLHDPLNGFEDIAARRIRFIDKPEDRIREDYLRILRFFRFHAWYGDPDQGIDPDALAACAELAEGVESLSKERIGVEIRKLLSAPDPAPSVATMAICGILARLLPGATTAALPVLVHLEASHGVSADWRRRLVVLGGENIAENLRLSTRDARHVGLVRDLIGSPKALPELAYRHGVEIACDVALAKGALLSQALPKDFQDEIAAAARQAFPVRAADLMPAFQGPALGQRLEQLKDRWIASGFSLDRDALLK
jgi:poly(A) polymerase